MPCGLLLLVAVVVVVLVAGGASLEVTSKVTMPAPSGVSQELPSVADDGERVAIGWVEVSQNATRIMKVVRGKGLANVATFTAGTQCWVHLVKVSHGTLITAWEARDGAGGGEIVLHNGVTTFASFKGKGLSVAPHPSGGVVVGWDGGHRMWDANGNLVHDTADPFAGVQVVGAVETAKYLVARAVDDGISVVEHPGRSSSWHVPVGPRIMSLAMTGYLVVWVERGGRVGWKDLTGTGGVLDGVTSARRVAVSRSAQGYLVLTTSDKGLEAWEIIGGAVTAPLLITPDPYSRASAHPTQGGVLIGWDELLPPYRSHSAVLVPSQSPQPATPTPTTTPGPTSNPTTPPASPTPPPTSDPTNPPSPPPSTPSTSPLPPTPTPSTSPTPSATSPTPSPTSPTPSPTTP
eukprot:Sspe_Gene.102006::Locus_76696_Transcript_1_1_Confidence_1.000_Length_1253::g.102006::m.102006